MAAGLSLRSLLPLVALLALACRRLPSDCEYDSLERCLWERGGATPGSTDAAGPKGEGGGEGQLEGGDELIERWDDLDTTLDRLAELIGSGLEWPLVDERARELCGSPPTLRHAEDDDDPRAWVCPLAGMLELDGHTLQLEVGEGVVSLTSDELTEQVSGKLVALALDTTRQSCEGGFQSVDGPVNQEFQRCTLHAGPLLYIGRFPRDLDADRWQVSLAVVDAG